jgi:uncharacterized membrane protein
LAGVHGPFQGGLVAGHAAFPILSHRIHIFNIISGEMNMAVFLESLVLFLDACRFMVSKVSGGRVRNLEIQNISHII